MVVNIILHFLKFQIYLNLYTQNLGRNFRVQNGGMFLFFFYHTAYKILQQKTYNGRSIKVINFISETVYTCNISYFILLRGL